MISAKKPSMARVVLVMLGCGTLLALMAVPALFLLGQPGTASAHLVTPEREIRITAVPTVERAASLVLSQQPSRLSVEINSSPLIASAEPPLSVQVAVQQTIPGPLVDPTLSLLRGPVNVPLEIQIPVLKIKAPVLGVGLTLANAMASPIGIFSDDPIWQTVFWYRGGGIPGDIGTATFAGHFDDALGHPAIFAYLGNLRIGDLIIVRDLRHEFDIPFIVTETIAYTNEETLDPVILARIFGAGSVIDPEVQPVSDQLSHLTLITCAGAWIDGSFNLRQVVYAVRASYPLDLGE